MSYASIKHIVDGPVFLRGIFMESPGGGDIKVIIDPHFTSDNRVRFKELRWLN